MGLGLPVGNVVVDNVVVVGNELGLADLGLGWLCSTISITMVDLAVDLVMVVDLIFSDLAVDLIFSRWWIWSQLWIWSWLGLDLRWLNSCGGVFIGLWWPVMGLCWVCGGGGGGGGWQGFGLWLLGLYE